MPSTPSTAAPWEQGPPLADRRPRPHWDDQMTRASSKSSDICHRRPRTVRQVPRRRPEASWQSHQHSELRIVIQLRFHSRPYSWGSVARCAELERAHTSSGSGDSSARSARASPAIRAFTARAKPGLSAASISSIRVISLLNTLCQLQWDRLSRLSRRCQSRANRK